MDLNERDVTFRREADRLASLEELFTDFEQWLEKLKQYVLNRSTESNREENSSKWNQDNLRLQELLIHGIFIQETPAKIYNSIIVKNIDSFISSDYVILNIIRNMVSWGNPSSPPILLLHGYLDTAATFTFLVDKLPDNYYYVGIDIPGHGKSDPFPAGILVTLLYIIEAVRVVVEHMRWSTFTFLSHSTGFIIGLCYHHFYPGRIEKMICLDPKPAIAWYYVMEYHLDQWYKQIYSQYYENYQTFNFASPKTRTLESWTTSLSRARKLTEGQSKILLSRTLIPTGDNKYKLSFEPRCRIIAHLHIPIETLFTIMTSDSLPTLVINASQYQDFVRVANSKKFKEDIFIDCEKVTANMHQVLVNGNHDFHISNPEPIAEEIRNFLNYNESVNMHHISKL